MGRADGVNAPTIQKIGRKNPKTNMNRWPFLMVVSPRLMSRARYRKKSKPPVQYHMSASHRLVDPLWRLPVGAYRAITSSGRTTWSLRFMQSGPGSSETGDVVAARAVRPFESLIPEPTQVELPHSCRGDVQILIGLGAAAAASCLVTAAATVRAGRVGS
jgi:hypothetical protein